MKFIHYRYNSWACTQCRRALAEKFNDELEANDPFQWLHVETTFQTPSTATSFFSEYRHQDEPADPDMTPIGKTTGKKELKSWLKATNYTGRYRSTNNYSALDKHDRTAFRSQFKAIFRHVLEQFAPNDVDVIWSDIIDEELQKPRKQNMGSISTAVFK